MPSSDFILSADIAYKKMQRMAFEILERNIGETNIILAGIKDNGVIIAHVIKEFLTDIFKGEISVMEININKTHPKEVIAFPGKNFDDAVIIITDDVVNSGKTLLYALRPFINFYPKKIQTLVLVARSYKEFPISVDYVGLSVATATNEKIFVKTEDGKIIGARLQSG